ncbi:MAG: hypothetical protein KDI38_10945, partial [Calditrichaeota bacterium]|nr:hypothetical protein [Calditrichota bacterium]
KEKTSRENVSKYRERKRTNIASHSEQTSPAAPANIARSANIPCIYLPETLASYFRPGSTV